MIITVDGVTYSKSSITEVSIYGANSMIIARYDDLNADEIILSSERNRVTVTKGNRLVIFLNVTAKIEGYDKR